jgi:hypothetical protein
MSTPDYVEVRDEPRHRHRFENGFARVYDVLVHAADTTLYHRHVEDTLYVSIGEATVREQTWGEEQASTHPVPSGIAVCRPHRSEPLTHKVSNVGESDMRMIGAEVKLSPAEVAKDPLKAAGHELRWETERLRAYDLCLEPEGGTGEIDYAFSGLTVALTQACLTQRDRGGLERTLVLAPGDVIWHAGPATLSITNVGVRPYRAVVAEWR